MYTVGVLGIVVPDGVVVALLTLFGTGFLSWAAWMTKQMLALAQAQAQTAASLEAFIKALDDLQDRTSRLERVP